jgi:hypothetical protein
MSGSLLAASWPVVAQPPVLVPVGVAALLTLTTAPYLDSGHADQVRIGVATVLACALAATAEDPTPEITAATPRPRWVPCVARLLLGLALVLPIAILSLTLTLTQHQGTGTPTHGAGVQMLAVLMLGPALGFGVWAWGNAAQPTYAAMVGVVCIALVLWLLPATWSVLQYQPWGPPWEAALIRWSALVLLGCALALSAWRDPATRPRS